MEIQRKKPNVQTLTCPECGQPLKLRPVAGAKHFPRRLECPVHGYKPRVYRLAPKTKVRG